MPTAAKLAAAILFGALAWYVSQLVKPLFPEGTYLGRFAEYNCLVGLVVGWQVAGGRARTTWANAVGYGITAALSMLLIALFLYSFKRMLDRSFRRIYEGPFEALTDAVRIVVDNFTFILTPEIMMTLLVGGIAGGLMTEWVARNYR